MLRLEASGERLPCTCNMSSPAAIPLKAAETFTSHDRLEWVVLEKMYKGSVTDDVVVTSGGSELQRNSSGLQRRSSGLRRDSSSIRRPSFNRAASDNSPTRDFARSESGQGRGASPRPPAPAQAGQGAGGRGGWEEPAPLPQPQEQDLQAAWELEVWKNAEEV